MASKIKKVSPLYDGVLIRPLSNESRTSRRAIVTSFAPCRTC